MGIIISAEEEIAGQRGQAICQKAKGSKHCFSSMRALGRHHRLLLQRRRPRCWEVGDCGHTASWGRAGSQQTWCLPPSRPHGPLPGTGGPSPGMETPWPGPSPLCGSKLPILPPGSAGLRSGAWSSPGGPGRTPAGPRESRAESDALRKPTRQRPGPRLRGRPGRLGDGPGPSGEAAPGRPIRCWPRARPPPPLSDAVHGGLPLRPRAE